MSIIKLYEIHGDDESINEETGEKLFSLSLPQATLVVKAKSRGEAIVFLSGIAGKEAVVNNRDQIVQHFGPVVQVDHSGQVDEPK